jgi:hypothetical protein
MIKVEIEREDDGRCLAEVPTLGASGRITDQSWPAFLTCWTPRRSHRTLICLACDCIS